MTMPLELQQFLLPPGLLLVLAILGFGIARWNRRVGHCVAWPCLAGFYLLATPLVSGAMMASRQTIPALDLPAATSSGAQAIVVLAGDALRHQPEYAGDTVGPLTLGRLRWAARLHRETELPILVAGGLTGPGRPSFAAMMTEVLERDFRVAVRWREGESGDTTQNATRSARILLPLGIKRILLVTTGFHMPRAVEAFRAAGFDPVPAPTGFWYWRFDELSWRDALPSARALSVSTWVFHELVGGWWYRLRARWQ